METIRHNVQFCVIGGGIAGMCAALAAARHGVKTLIMQERPMFGGNASSEVRMWICGARYDLETGIVEELRLENLYRNTYPNYSVWDGILFEKMRFQENLECLLNCSCQDATMDGSRIVSVKGWQMTTQQFHVVEADYFADCSGDSVLVPLTGAEARWGREAKAEFGESLAQDVPDGKTMGMSCLIQARETDSPKKFIPPAWATKFPDDASFPDRDHTLLHLQNFWWLELGGNGNSIADTETVRDQLLKDAYGLWDHIKNHGDHGAENWMLDWVGILPGKRESRRCIGDYLLNQNDVLNATKFDDIVAFGGWPVDDHHPDGFRHFGPPNTNILPSQSYGIPLRCLYSKNIDNLFFAGRNISATHTGISSTRVMATCALVGQAVGTAVYHAVAAGGLSPRETAKTRIRAIQQTLLDDDCWLLGMKRDVPELSLRASLTVTSGDGETLRNGYDRPYNGKGFMDALKDETFNAWLCHDGDSAEYDFGAATPVRLARIVFDSDLGRGGRNMKNHNYYLKQDVYEPPATLVKAYHIEADGKEVFRDDDNHQRLVFIPLNVTARTVKLVIDAVRTPDAPTKVFSFDVR